MLFWICLSQKFLTCNQAQTIIIIITDNVYPKTLLHEADHFSGLVIPSALVSLEQSLTKDLLVLYPESLLLTLKLR